MIQLWMGLDVCQDIIVAGNKITECRHCIKMGNTTRSVIVTNNYVSTTTGHTAPIENHPSCEYITIKNNYIWGGGIYMRGMYTSILDNIFFIDKGASSCITIVRYGFSPRKDDFINIIGNKTINNTTPLRQGIAISFLGSDDYIEKLMIVNNQITVDEVGIITSRKYETNTNNKINEIIIDGNYIESSVSNAIYLMEGIVFNHIKQVNNTIKAANAGIVVIGEIESGDLYINNVTIDAQAAPIIISENIKNAFIKNNNLKGLNEIIISCSNNFIMQSNTLIDMPNGGINISSNVQKFIYTNNVEINITGMKNNNAQISTIENNY